MYLLRRNADNLILKIVSCLGRTDWVQSFAEMKENDTFQAYLFHPLVLFGKVGVW